MILQYISRVLVYLLAIQQAYSDPDQVTKDSCQNSEPLMIPEYIRAGVHPGLYMGKTGIVDESEFRQRRIEAYKKTPKFQLTDTQQALSLFHQIAKSYVVDQMAGEGKPQARTAHDKAWDWAINNILQNDKSLTEYSELELLEMLNTLNDILNPPVSRKDEILMYYAKITQSGRDSRAFSDPSVQKAIENFLHTLDSNDAKRKQMGKNPYGKLRQLQISITIDQNFPGFDKYDESIAYLRKNSPKDIVTFNSALQKLLEISKNNDKNASDFDTFKKWVRQSSAAEKDFIQSIFNYALDVKHLPKAMRNFLIRLPKKIKEDPIKGAVYAHMRIAKLHPYDDANGRTARMLMNCVLLQNGYPAVHFYRNKEYTAAIVASLKKNDYSIFEAFLRKSINMHQKGLVEQEDLADKIQACEEDCQSVFDTEFAEYEHLGLAP